MADWLTGALNKLRGVLGNYQDDSGALRQPEKGNNNIKLYNKQRDLDKGVAIQHDDTQVNGNQRTPNSVTNAQNLEDMKYKHFSNMNNTEGSVTKALDNYAKEVFGKPLSELNEEEYRSVCNAARGYASKSGVNSPANQLKEHYTIILNKFKNNN